MSQRSALRGRPGSSLNSLTSKRVRFVHDLIKRRGELTQREIIAEMHKHPHLLHRDSSTGHYKPILSKAVSRLMQAARIKPKQKIKFAPIISNDPQSINNRYLYAQKYLQLTSEGQSEVYFLGEFSFGFGKSLSYCPKERKQEFVEGNQFDSSSKLDVDPTRNTQCLVVLSQKELPYFQLFSNIFAELNFSKTLASIATTLNRINPQARKYLIL